MKRPGQPAELASRESNFVTGSFSENFGADNSNVAKAVPISLHDLRDGMFFVGQLLCPQ
jgi:hypothetical protein